MDNTFLLLLAGGAFLLGIVLIRRASLISETAARQLIAQGASIIDVRTPEEYASDKLPGAINIPLAELSARIESVTPRREDALLLHCLSGGRSAVARRILRQMGYRQAHNLGSFRRARKILSQSRAQ